MQKDRTVTGVQTVPLCTTAARPAGTQVREKMNRSASVPHVLTEGRIAVPPATCVAGEGVGLFYDATLTVTRCLFRTDTMQLEVV